MSSQDNLITPSLFTDSNEETMESDWWMIPDVVLLKILRQLPTKDVINASLTCSRWYNIASYDFKWKKKFEERFQVWRNIELKPGAESWISEYRRLSLQSPIVEAQCLEAHTKQVLHVSFAHNGEMFATCSRDRNVIIWNSQHPCVEKYRNNTNGIFASYPQRTEFNGSDSLLLVACFIPISAIGKIAIFSVDSSGLHLKCHVPNEPFDLFGTWINNNQFISGKMLYMQYGFKSVTQLWLNDIKTVLTTENKISRRNLCKLVNSRSASTRCVIVAKCPWLNKNRESHVKKINELIGSGSTTVSNSSMEPCCLIWMMTSLTSTSNEIGIKCIPEIWPSYAVDNEEDRISAADWTINCKGFAIGMVLSPDHQFLYVNVRSQPDGIFVNYRPQARIENDTEIRVVDLKKLESIYSTAQCFSDPLVDRPLAFGYIFLDAADTYVATGGVCRNAHLWDRHYCTKIVEYNHRAVNCVAFNPRDSQMMITVSTDSTIKIWRSVAQAKKNDIPYIEA